MQLVARGAPEVFGAGGVAAGEDALRILHAHLLHRVDEDGFRLRDRLLGSAVHRHDELVGILAHADPSKHLLGALR